MSLRERLAKARRRYRDYKQKKADTRPHSERRQKLARAVRFWRDRRDRLVAALDERRHSESHHVFTSGSPHWGGADDILEREVEPVARRHGLEPNSAKRTETYGNPSSDHYVGNTTASARDFPTANNYALRNEIMRALGVEAVISDYGSYYIYRDGYRFRVQPIAGTHGTGPHLHIGVARA